MVYGPCGGVRDGGGCEMRAGPCAFPEPVVREDTVPAHRLTVVPRVLSDFSSPSFDLDMLTRISAIMAPSCDAVLVGEHQNRPDFPPALLGRALLDTGVRPWLTLACRDRNRIVLEQELHGLRHVGVDTVLCVTGDGRAYDVRPDVTQVFDLDGPRLAELATRIGLSAAVPEAPLAPPIALRPQRLVGKQRSGAAVAVLNHATRPDEIAGFMAAARAAGLTIPVIASVAVYTDPASAAALLDLPGFHLDRDTVREVLDARDPVAAGTQAAVAEAVALLDIEGIEGVNISGAASDRGWEYAASVKAAVGAAVREAAP